MQVKFKNFKYSLNPKATISVLNNVIFFLIKQEYYSIYDLGVYFSENCAKRLSL